MLLIFLSFYLSLVCQSCWFSYKTVPWACLNCLNAPKWCCSAALWACSTNACGYT